MGEGCIINFYALMRDMVIYHLSICMCTQMLLAFLTRISLYTKHTFLIGCGYMAGHLYSFHSSDSHTKRSVWFQCGVHIAFSHWIFSSILFEQLCTISLIIPKTFTDIVEYSAFYIAVHTCTHAH